MTPQLRRLSHTVYDCKYHIIWCPKYRYRVFQDTIATYTTQPIYRLCARHEHVEVLALNVQPDHIHLVVSIPPKYAIAAFMGYLKGTLAIRLFQRFPLFRSKYWGRHLWSRGYCVTTIGLDEAKVRQYVEWQECQDRQDEAQPIKD